MYQHCIALLLIVSSSRVLHKVIGYCTIPEARTRLLLLTVVCTSLPHSSAPMPYSYSK